MNSSYSYSNITCLSDGFAANYESCESFNATACNAFPCKIKVDPDIGGIGIIYSFVITVWLSFLVAILVTIGDWTSPTQAGHHYLQPAYGHWLRDVLEPVALALSDTALITGFALLLAAFFRFSRCQLSVYHYQLIRTMVLLSIISHALVLQVLAGYTRRWWRTMGGIRIATLLALFGMWAWYIFTGNDMPNGQTPFVSLPASCYYKYSDPSEFRNHSGNNVALQHAPLWTATAIAFLTILFSSLRWLRAFVDGTSIPVINCLPILHRLGYGYPIRIFIQTVGLGASAVFYTMTLIKDWTVPNTGSGATLVPPLANSSQADWGFGQVVPLALLASIALVFLEAWRTRPEPSQRESWTTPSPETGKSLFDYYGYQNALAKSGGGTPTLSQQRLWAMQAPSHPIPQGQAVYGEQDQYLLDDMAARNNKGSMASSSYQVHPY